MEEIPGAFKGVKKVIRKLVGWYVEPIVAKQREEISNQAQITNISLREMNAQLREAINEFKEEGAHLDKENEALQKAIKSLEQQHDNLYKSVKNIEDREEWTRGRFTEQQQRIEDIEGREEWARGRFTEQQQRIEDIEAREEWTRERFKEQLLRIENIEEREIWSRERFNEHGNKIDGLLKNGASSSSEVFYNKKSYSQSGEDTICAYITNFLGIPMHEVTYLDLGANHAKDMSNSYYFYEQGARGVLVEANPELIQELEKEREGDLILNRAVALDEKETVEFYSLSGDGLSTISYESAQHACEVNPEIYIKQKYTIQTITINELLKSYFNNTPTILSIDLEGIEEEILGQVDFKQYRPLIIILENIPYRPYLVIEMKQDKVLDLMQRNDYVEYAFTGINSIYIDKKYIQKFNEEKVKNN